MAVSLKFGYELVGVSEILLSNPKFYIVIAMIPAVNLFRDVFWKIYKRMFHYEPYHIAQEIQAIELKPILKPKIIRVVDKIQKKLPKISGYAFSQSDKSTLERLRPIEETQLVDMNELERE
eukprot:NODE_193_length_15440_cov_0.478587.p8 type:complete len:121 gc:universal NODE_193_length_15440_cov_0.478587:7646-8008(+)